MLTLKHFVCRKLGSGATEEGKKISFGKENERLLWAMLCEVLKHKTLPHAYDQAAEAWKLA